MDSSFALFIPSFVAGIFTFFAPCTLPLVPAFLGVIAGVKQEDLSDAAKLKRLRGKIFANALFYVLGFSLIFILFGVAFAYLGTILSFRLWIQRIGGILVILFGLVLLGLIKWNLFTTERAISAPRLYQKASIANSFAIGALFALGWTPCVGPLLGSILFLASTAGTVVQGTLLLVVFAAGLGLPFLITALAVGRALTAFSRLDKMLKFINVIAGIFLIILGILLFTDRFVYAFNTFRSYLLRIQFYEEYINRFL